MLDILFIGALLMGFIMVKFIADLCERQIDTKKE